MINETQRPEKETPPPQLYHYTSNEAFLGILQNRCLWASHLLYQNDRTEILHTLKILKKKLKNRFGRKLKSDSLEFLADFLRLNVFTVSFSEKVDDLNQYRGYAKSNPGFCVGFYSKYLKSFEVPKLDGNDSPEWSCRLEKCDYNKDEQEKSIDRIIDEGFEDINVIDSENGDLEIAGKLYFKIREKARIYKSAAFKDEQEWRLIIWPQSTGKDSRIKERIRGSFFMPYFPISICTRCAIGDIYVFPCQKNDDVYNSVWTACENNGIDFFPRQNLLASTIPYRTI